MINIDFQLEDWPEGALRSPPEPDSISLTIEVHDNTIRVDTEDGRSVYLKLREGDLCILSRNKAPDSLLCLKVPLVGEVVVAPYDRGSGIPSRRERKAS